MSKYKKDNIYIDCQPVNSKGQTLVNMSKDDDSKESSNTMEKILKSPFLALIIGALILIILTKVANKILSKM
tara:strand:+ start:66 stop:281 length:216 start_codon:yes stop_codon:yes gene_type:complete